MPPEMPRNRPSDSLRRRPRFAEVISLPALLTIGVGVLLLAGLAVLPMIVWQFNPMLWRQLLRLQGAVAGFVVGVLVGALLARFSGSRR